MNERFSLSNGEAMFSISTKNPTVDDLSFIREWLVLVDRRIKRKIQDHKDTEALLVEAMDRAENAAQEPSND